MAEFRWLNKQGVASDQGFEVQVIDRFCTEYREHGKTISVEFEMGLDGGKSCLLISPGSFAKWDDQSPESQISLDEQYRIEENFRRAMGFQGVIVVFQSPD